jgi:hypothetical protein
LETSGPSARLMKGAREGSVIVLFTHNRGVGLAPISWDFGSL